MNAAETFEPSVGWGTPRPAASHQGLAVVWWWNLAVHDGVHVLCPCDAYYSDTENSICCCTPTRFKTCFLTRHPVFTCLREAFGCYVPLGVPWFSCVPCFRAAKRFKIHESDKKQQPRYLPDKGLMGNQKYCKSNWLGQIGDPSATVVVRLSLLIRQYRRQSQKKNTSMNTMFPIRTRILVLGMFALYRIIMGHGAASELRQPEMHMCVYATYHGSW